MYDAVICNINESNIELIMPLDIIDFFWVICSQFTLFELGVYDGGLVLTSPNKWNYLRILKCKLALQSILLLFTHLICFKARRGSILTKIYFTCLPFISLGIWRSSVCMQEFFLMNAACTIIESLGSLINFSQDKLEGRDKTYHDKD